MAAFKLQTNRRAPRPNNYRATPQIHGRWVRCAPLRGLGQVMEPQGFEVVFGADGTASGITPPAPKQSAPSVNWSILALLAGVAYLAWQ